MEDTVKDQETRLVDDKLATMKFNEAEKLWNEAKSVLQKHRKSMERKAEKIIRRQGTEDEQPEIDEARLNANNITKVVLEKARNTAYSRKHKAMIKMNEAQHENEDEAKAKTTKTASGKAPEKNTEEKYAKRVADEMDRLQKSRKTAMKLNRGTRMKQKQKE